MLPNKKMAQFIENEDWHPADVAAVESLARERFTETYNTSVRSENTEPSVVVQPPVSIKVYSVRTFSQLTIFSEEETFQVCTGGCLYIIFSTTTIRSGYHGCLLGRTKDLGH